MSKLILKEDLFDTFIIPDVATQVTVSDSTPNPPEVGYDTGLSVLIIDAIKDEWETIAKYNTMIQNLTDEGMVDVIKDIVAEENTHVGQLQKMLYDISPNVENIQKGELEAENQLEEGDSLQ